LLTHLRPSDPETLDWNLFDDNYRKQLDHRQYVSPSRDRETALAAGESNSNTASSELPSPVTAEPNKETDTTKNRAQTFADDKDLELDDPESDEEDTEIPEGSLFEYNIPGILTKEQVEKLDLDHWKLVVRDTLIELEVR
jgi:hypothetical protein